MTKIEELVKDYKKGSSSEFNPNHVNDLVNITCCLSILDLDDDEDDVRQEFGDALVELQDWIIEHCKTANEVFNYMWNKKLFDLNEPKDEIEEVRWAVNYFCWIYDAYTDEYLENTKDEYEQLVYKCLQTGYNLLKELESV